MCINVDVSNQSITTVRCVYSVVGYQQHFVFTIRRNDDCTVYCVYRDELQAKVYVRVYVRVCVYECGKQPK